MANVLVRGLSEATVAVLKQQARQNRRSMQREIRAILEEAAESAERRRRMVEVADSLRARASTSFPQQTDSVNLVREDRVR